MNIHGKLTRVGRWCRTTDGQPGVECQLDFGRWAGLRPGHGTLAAHALIFTGVYSPGPVRHAQDKPRVEQVAPDVRENFFRGEHRMAC